MKPGKSGIARLIDATSYSMQGLSACWRSEAAFRQEVALCVVLFPASFYLATSVEQWLLLIVPLFLLLIVELLHSAVEATVDRIGFNIRQITQTEPRDFEKGLIGIGKDVETLADRPGIKGVRGLHAALVEQYKVEDANSAA